MTYTKRIKQFLLGDETKAVQSSMFWNSAGGMLSAFQSVFFLMILSRVLGLAESGLFSIAFANANLFANIGRFGVRNYQVSDVNGTYTFREYLRARMWSTGLMVLVFTGYLVVVGIVRQYSMYKFILIFFVCFSKIIDSIEDVYYGYLQQHGRLDIGAKILTIRLSVLYISFILVVLIFRNQLWAVIISTILSGASCFWCFYLVRRATGIHKEHRSRAPSRRNVIALLAVCFPLFLSTFLSIYIGNAPKYAIDQAMSEEMQAIFSFISMPIFVINLLNNFIYQPFLFRLSNEWNKRQLKRFKRSIWIEVIVIAIITAVVLLAGKLIGIEVLSLLYSVQLADYETDFLILLAGGGLLAYSGFFISILTIMRKQMSIAWIYGGVSVLAFLLSPILIRTSGIRGASNLYFILMLILAVFSGVLMVRVFNQAVRERKRKQAKKKAA